MTKAMGSVFLSTAKEHISGAVVKAVKDQQILTATTDANGNFVFDNLEPGVWSFTTTHEGHLPSRAKEVDLSQDQEGISLYLGVPESEADQRSGQSFFWSAIGLLGILVVAYLVLHLVITPVQTPLSSSLIDLLNRIEAQLGSSSDVAQDAVLKGLTTGLSTVVDTATTKTTRLSAVDKQVATRLADTVTLAVSAGQKDAALSELASLRQLIANPPVSRFQFWGDVPLRFLEILLWGLAGILVSKIIQVGWYLRTQRFYRQGIVMHISHLVATPLLVLVTVLILSLVTFNVTLASGNQVNIDLSEPNLMVAFAFIIGTSPWPLWRFIEDTAKRFTGQLEDSAISK